MSPARVGHATRAAVPEAGPFTAPIPNPHTRRPTGGRLFAFRAWLEERADPGEYELRLAWRRGLRHMGAAVLGDEAGLVDAVHAAKPMVVVGQ